MPGRLELRQEPGGLRYYLDGRGVHAADILELQLWTEPFTENAKEIWVSGRYEWSYDKTKPPTFHVFQGWWGHVTKQRYEEGTEPTPAQAVLHLEPWAVLRWPKKRETGLMT